MKNIYFVRHGESEANVGLTGVNVDAPLTKQGRKQAQVVAERCRHLPVEVIISSTLIRAQQTAEIIKTEITKPLETSDLLVERRYPTEFAALKEKELNLARSRVKGFFYEPGFRYSDEENFEDIIVRARKALTLLSERKEEHILVITHGSFLRDMVALAVFKDNLTPIIRRSMTKGFGTNNTGLTLMYWDETSTQWTVATWNDHAHLG